MAGPRMIGIRDVVNPVDGLQDTVSKVGGIYQSYEEERRASDLHAQKMAEAERAENARQYLRNYTPEFGGGDFKGIDADTKKAMIQEEKKLLESLGPDASPDEYRRVASGITERRKQLVTREAVTADVFNDLIRNGVDSETAKHLAAIEGSKYDSLDDRVKAETESAKATEERRNKQAEIAINAMKARKPAYSRLGSNTGDGGGSGSKGVQALDTEAKVKEFLDNAISPFGINVDANAAYGNLKSAVREVNKRRAAAGEKDIGFGDISNLILFSTTSGEPDNDVVYQSSGEWQDAIETYLRSSGGSNRQGGYGGVAPTEDEQRAITAALRGTGTRVRGRAELAATRVRGVYGDLYNTLSNATADPSGDGGVQVLGGTGNSGVGRSTGTRAENNSPTNSSPSPVPVGENSPATGTPAPEGRLPQAAETVLPPELATQKEDLQSRIQEIRNKAPGTRSYQDSFILGNLESRLAAITKTEEQLVRERNTPRINAAYQTALESGVGTNVPEELYSARTTSIINRYTPAQLSTLSDNVTKEIDNYRAVLDYAEQNGDRLGAFQARSKLWKLSRMAPYIDQRLNQTRLPK